MPPYRGGGRHRRLRPCDQRPSHRGEALAARARGRRGRIRAAALSASGGTRESDASLLDAFCDALWLEDGLAKNSIAAYRADLAQLAAFLGKKSLTDAVEADLFAFLASRKGRASSAARRVSTLKRFFQYCVREHRVDADPTIRLDPPKR